MTDDQIRKAYRAAGPTYEMTDIHITQARAFIAALFDDLTPAGYLDGATFAQEEWELQHPEALYRRPL